MPSPPAYPSPPPNSLSVVDVENAVGSRLAMAELGLMAPLLVAGRYRVQRLLGRGARGVVCQAQDLHLHREVALKLYPALEPGPVAQEVALEAQALARLRHPNVVGVYDFGDTTLVLEHHPPMTVPCFFMTMEHIRGQSMRRWLSVGAPDHDQVLSAFRQAGAGLAHAHEAGVIHRDFKPENVVVADDGRVMVVDFGLARHRSGTQISPSADSRALVLWQPFVIAGTPEYMAPEARLGRAEASSDQYSFAVALVEALLGSLPSMTEQGLPRIAIEQFPAAIGRVIKRALAFEPRDRFGSVRDLLSELPTTWVEQLRWMEVAAEPPRSQPQPRRWLAGFGVGALIVGWIGAAAWWVEWTPEEAETKTNVLPSAPLVRPLGSLEDCAERSVVGIWRFKTQIWWDYRMRDFGVREYSLEITRGEGCRLVGRLNKPDAEFTGEAPLEVRHRGSDGSIELRGAWQIEHRGAQPYTFNFSIGGDRLLGDFVHYSTLGRPAVKGPVYGARLHRKLPEVERRSDLPCRSQCRLLCAGADAVQQCESSQCESIDTEVRDCGPPSADFIPPINTDAMLTQWDRGEWQAASDGPACTRVPVVLAGTWTIHERPKQGRPVEWTVDLRDLGNCRLIGSARSAGEDRNVVVELNPGGLWMLFDPADPEGLRWAMYGWDFVVGERGGDRSARIRGQRISP